MALVDRVKGILLNPKPTWAAIEAEPATPAGLYKDYLLWLAAIPAVIFYNKLSGESGRIVGGYEVFADEFATLLSRESNS